MKLLSIVAFLVFFAHCNALTKNYTSYRRYPWCSPSYYMRYPKNSADVVAIVKKAISRGVKVKAFGARHSQTDIICTEGIPIDMNALQSCQMNPDNITATFGSGVTIRKATEFLLQHGRALRTNAAYGLITLGGALGTGAHGSTIKYNATLSEQVVKMTVVNGKGEIIEISDPDDLKSFKINLGLLGIVVDITLYTVPLYKVLARNYVVSEDVFTNGEAFSWAKSVDQITLFWFPVFKEVVVANLTFVDVSTQGNAWTNAIVTPTYGLLNFFLSKLLEIAFDLTSSACAAASTLGYTILHGLEYATELSLWTQIPGFVPIYTEDNKLIANPAVGYPHLMFDQICSETSTGSAGLACFWAHGNIQSNITILDNEFGIALTDLPAFITSVKDIVRKTPTAFPLQGMFIRFSRASNAYMSTAYKRDTAHIEFVLANRKNPYKHASGSLAGYQTILQTLAKKFNARSHWGKSGHVYHSSEMLTLKLDSVARTNFIAAMNKFDPKGIFLNNFGRRLAKKGSKIDFDPLTTRCALLDNCFCAEDSDCADTQICTSLSGYDDYPVCKTKNEVAEMQFDKNILPPPLGVIDWLVTTIPTLLDAALGKCSLSSVLETVWNVLRPLLV